MLPSELLENKINTLQDLLMGIGKLNIDVFSECAEIFARCLKNKNTIFWCGNGGSAAESSHLATELIGRFKRNRLPYSSISLNSDTAAITCIANDFGYDEVFARQLEGLAKPGDLLIVLSTSGQSENIAKALRKARQIGVQTIALVGKDGGIASSLADYSILINSQETARIQEVHLFLGHTLCEYGEISLGVI